MAAGGGEGCKTTSPSAADGLISTCFLNPGAYFGAAMATEETGDIENPPMLE